MPRRDLSDAERAAMAYWPQIDHAARAGLTTAELWDSIRESAAQYGLERPGVGIIGVSQLRARAGEIAAANNQLADLADNRVMRAAHIPVAPYARPAGERRAEQRIAARFLHTTNRAGSEEQAWRTVMFTGPLPRTIGELRTRVQDEAIQLARGYQSDHLGVDELQFVQV